MAQLKFVSEKKLIFIAKMSEIQNSVLFARQLVMFVLFIV